MQLLLPERLQRGDKVAIVTPSFGCPALFPGVYELGLERIRNVFNLEPIEFPNTRRSPEYLTKHPEARADDINAAFADASIKAIIATIGGNDEIRILPFLDQQLIQKNPKIFLGYSDNTNIHLMLWNLGIISYYGGNVLSTFGMQHSMHDYTIDYIHKALFERSIGEIYPATEWTDADLDWAEPQNLLKERPMYKGNGWKWHNSAHKKVKGRLWGGCLEVLDLHLAVRSYLPPLESFRDTILYIETSEEMPTQGFVYRFIAALGEIGILDRLQAILVGRPKGQFLHMQPPEGREQFFVSQHNAIVSALADYNSDLIVIFDMDFGHTDPMVIVPNGGMVSIDGEEKRIWFE